MNIYRKILSLQIALLFAVSLSSLFAVEEALSLGKSSSGKSFSVSLSVFSNAPNWEPGKTEIPLSLEKAVELAIHSIQKLDPEYKESEVTGINLRRFSSYRFGTKWYYHIIASPIILGEIDYRKSTDLILLMSGEAITAK